MTATPAPLPAGVTLGPFDVATDRAAVARFARATRSSAAGVPATFPIVWLAHAAIRTAIEACARSGEIAFHEDQAFDYRVPLVADAIYRLRATVERCEQPARVSLASDVEKDGATVLRMRTVLRLVSTSGIGTDTVHRAGEAQQ